MSLKEISLYIHIPFCVSKCNYCDFFSIPTGCKNNSVPPEYIDALCNEMVFRFKEYGPCIIKTVYIGGGTPSLLNRSQLEQIYKTINTLGLASDYEFSFEVNPDDVTAELLQTLEDCGVNRISCGIQSFCDDVLKNVHRRADEKTVYECLSLLKNNWHKRLSVDLICGLPGETQQTQNKGLEYLVQNKISHISFYSLCVEEETPLGNAIINGKQKYDEDYTDELWLKGSDYLLKNGYVQYEVSNFCLPQNECMHNMTYWTHKDYIGCGSGAAGTIYNKGLYFGKLEKKGEGFRYTNIKAPDKYSAFWTRNQQEIAKNIAKIPQDVEKIRQKTSQFEYFMMGLRTQRGVSPDEYSNLFDEKMPPEILKKLDLECRKTTEGFYYSDKEKLLFLNTFLEEILNLLD